MSPVFQRIERILVPVDFSTYTDRVLEGAAFFATTMDATIELLHVWRPPLTHAKPWGAMLDVGSSPSDRDLETQFETALKGAKGHLRELGAKEVNTRLIQGIASSAILGLIAREAFDLVVMGNHGLTGLSHAYVGSVTERVLRSSPIPVLVVPSPGSETP